jgi:uncharacterized protein involved in exopolysaccharide biosynthesis
MSEAAPEDDFVDEQPFRVLAIVNTLLRQRWWIVGIAGLVTAVSIVMMLLATPVFTATAQFLPSQSQAVSSRMGSIIQSQSTGGRDDLSTDYYLALIKSPTFLGGVVVREFVDEDGSTKTLLAIYNPPGSSDREREGRAVERLEKAVTATAPRATLPQMPRIITLECKAKTATLAADICAAVLDEVRRHNAEVRGGKAKQNREFVEAQLEDARAELDVATRAFAAFTARNRKIVSPALEAEKDRLERQVRVKEDVFNTLSRQLVLARIEEQETRPSIEIIEAPIPPLQRSAPARTRTVMIAGCIGLMLGFIWALALDRWKRRDPGNPDTVEFRENISSITADVMRLLTLGRRGPTEPRRT